PPAPRSNNGRELLDRTCGERPRGSSIVHPRVRPIVRAEYIIGTGNLPFPKIAPLATQPNRTTTPRVVDRWNATLLRTRRYSRMGKITLGPIPGAATKCHFAPASTPIIVLLGRRPILPA